MQLLNIRIHIFIAAVGLFVGSKSVNAVSLVSDENIAEQKKLTKVYRLKNHIPVVYRQVPNSDILQIHISFKAGMRDLPAGEKDVNELLFATIPWASSKFPKETVFRTTEKYALSLNCGGGIETSSCALGTVNDFWLQGLPLLADLIKNPSLNKTDVELKKQQLLASTKSEMEDPDTISNDIVNKVFYPVGHPYLQSFESTLKELPTISREQLKAWHGAVLNANRMTIIIAGSLEPQLVVDELNRHFGTISGVKFERPKVVAPAFDRTRISAFEDRKIPTAYIKLKFNGDGITDKDAVAARLMIKVLDEELGEEIRTKRSLSYAVYSFLVQYEIGIGFISVSTSKPQETFSALKDVIKRMKTKDFSRRELEEYKHIYATSYFLTQEEHSTLAAALANSFNYFDTTDELYQMPEKLEKVTPQDIKRLAGKLLVNFRSGVVYDRAKFDDKWADDLIRVNVTSRRKK
jgi:zinc protease